MNSIISCLESKYTTHHLVIEYSGVLPQHTDSLEKALNPNHWAHHFHPFACVIHDTQHAIILLIRDHLGVEPLYYHFSDQVLIVSQTIGEILHHLQKRPDYNQRVLKKMGIGWMDYTDETHYKGIYRVEPGCTMHFKPDGSVIKKPFWTLTPKGPTLHYQDNRDYLAHFSSLMDESLLNSVGQHASYCASEFSAGLDSSAIYCTARDLGISPRLFMHQAPPGTRYAETYNINYEHAFLQHYPDAQILRIGSESFDPIEVFQQHATWFAGPAPYLFFMFATPLHRAVAQGKYKILLSGFGGDQCISGQIPKNFYIPELLRAGQFQRAWHELFGFKPSKSLMTTMKRTANYVSMMHSWPYFVSISYKMLRWHLGLQADPVHPYHWRHYRSVRGAEWYLLQGPDSYETRMRIEYSSIVAKKMGFSYRYPLLYPKLLEFMMSLPLEQKRSSGQGRYLMQRYLEYKLGNMFQTYCKSEGLAIIPSTLHMFQQIYEQGGYDYYFPNRTVVKQQIKRKDNFLQMSRQIQTFMLRFAEESRRAVLSS